MLGDYQLGPRLGAGGTSEVFAATQAGAPVAIKLLRDGEVDFDAVIAEAAKARAIAHPAVVRVLEVGRDAASGRCFLVMERLAGTLADRLRHGPLGEAAARVLGAALADGMSAAHARGVIHRDLKPSNVMFRGDAPVIVDFGIARSLGAAGAVVTQQRIGTLAYMAPEQLAAGVVAPSVDVWALGVILFEATTGRLPFAEFAGGQLPQLVEAAPRAGVSPAFDAIVARCLAREPGRRFATMAELAAALRAGTDERMTEDVAPRLAAAAAPGGMVPAPNGVGARSGRRTVVAWVLGATMAAALGVVAAFAIAPALRSQAGEPQTAQPQSQSGQPQPPEPAQLGIEGEKAQPRAEEPEPTADPTTAAPPTEQAAESTTDATTAVQPTEQAVPRPTVRRAKAKAPRPRTKAARPAVRPTQGETLD